MAMNWNAFPGAPAPGTVLCRVGDVPVEGVLALMASELPVLVLREAEVLRAFVNLCPHQFLPIDQRSGAIRSPDGARLVCSNHDAVFCAATGRALSGPVTGQCLSAVPLRIDGETVRIAEHPRGSDGAGRDRTQPSETPASANVAMPE